MNILVLAEKMDMAIKFACSLGGMKVDNNTIMLSDLDNGQNLKLCQNLARRYNHIRTQYDNNYYTFIWANGHCVTLKDAYDINPEWKVWWKIDRFIDMSINQETGNYDLTGSNFKVAFNKQPILNNIAKEFVSDSYDLIVSATDFGREGEAIFKFIYNYVRTKNKNKKIPNYKRAKIVEISEKAIRKGFENLIDSRDIQCRELAAYARAFSDKIIGDNMTVALTLKKDNPLRDSKGKSSLISCGRVQTPTLNMIIQRDNEIKNYVKQSKWRAEAEFETEKGETFKGLLLIPTNKEDPFELALQSDYLESEDDLAMENFIKEIREAEKDYYIQVIEEKEKKTSPPLLYDTNTLLVEADKKTSFNSKSVMAAMELLYQNGYISYPRTDSQYMNDNDKEKLHSVIFNLKNVAPLYEQILKQLGSINAMDKLFNSKKVNDHYAIIPTNKSLTRNKLYKLNINEIKREATNLSDDDIYKNIWTIYTSICNRTLAVVMPPKETKSMTIITSDGLFTFKSQVNKIIRLGWSYLYQNSDEEEENIDLDINVDDFVKVVDMKIKETFNKKPSYYTEGSLMAAMEDCGKLLEDKDYKDILKDAKGIGTPATRIGIIQTLLKRKYIKREGKYLKSTEAGRKALSLISIEDLHSPLLSAKWEAELRNLENGKDENGTLRTKNENVMIYKEFMEDVKNNTKEWIRIVNPEVSKKMKV